MAFPQIASTAESSTDTAGTSHIVTMPSGIQAGNLLLVILDKGSTSATIDNLAGWGELFDENQANGLYAITRKADGTEGASITLTSVGSTRTARIAYRITQAADPGIQNVEFGTTSSGTSTGPDPPSCAPVSGTAKDYLWIAFFGSAGEEADDDTWANTPPSGFTPSPPLQKACGTVGTNLGGLIAAASIESNTGSLDPTAFNMDVSAAWRAQTLCVHPAPVGIPERGGPFG